MKTFDEKEINKLLKTQKITIDEFVKTRDKELTIDEETLEAEKRTANALELISHLLAKIADKQAGDETHAKLLNCMVDTLNEIKGQKKPDSGEGGKEEWDFEIIRDRNDDISNVIAKQSNANREKFSRVK